MIRYRPTAEHLIQTIYKSRNFFKIENEKEKMRSTKLKWGSKVKDISKPTTCIDKVFIFTRRNFSKQWTRMILQLFFSDFLFQFWKIRAFIFCFNCFNHCCCCFIVSPKAIVSCSNRFIFVYLSLHCYAFSCIYFGFLFYFIFLCMLFHGALLYHYYFIMTLLLF